MKIATRLGLLVIVVAAPASADGEALRDVDPSDAIELARVVDRTGDAYVLARLGDQTPTDVRMAAIRASVMLDAPERALEALASIAIGRDPDLAPAAAIAIWSIARDLDPQELDAREVLRSELTPARTAITQLANDATARADLRRCAELALDALSSLGVPNE